MPAGIILPEEAKRALMRPASAALTPSKVYTTRPNPAPDSSDITLPTIQLSTLIVVELEVQVLRIVYN
ncbi:hypothetical protein J6590_056229 [Homalodisca vitripennis]|nr:hypothetical protein J6590_056229 [Homalodisca vitripennis]